MNFDPINTYPEFYGNPTIRSLADHRRWSVSDSNKRPINVPALVYENKLYGARQMELDTDCVTLGELVHWLPDAKNCAYFFDAQQANCLIIDIEKTCPPKEAKRLLKLATTEGLYSETSMSGKGYHILVPIPYNFYERTDMIQKVALQDENQHYEILLSHWVTFTRNPIDPKLLKDAASDAENNITVATLFDELCTQTSTRESANNFGDISNLDVSPNGYTEAQKEFDNFIAAKAKKVIDNTKRKSLEDFNEDTSRWEFSTLSLLVRATAQQISEEFTKRKLHREESPYSTTNVEPEHVIRIAFRLALEYIPHREKHDTQRNGLPYLLHQTIDAVRIVDIPVLKR